MVEGQQVRLKDWLCPLYEFGVHPTGEVDVAHRGDDLVTHVEASQAVELMRRVNSYVDAVQWLYDRSPLTTRRAFLEYAVNREATRE